MAACVALAWRALPVQSQANCSNGSCLNASNSSAAALGPCQNGGWCVNGASGAGYTCACQEEWSGINCAEHIESTDDCAAGGNDPVYGPCAHGGLCTDHLGGYACTCTSEFSGVNCEVASTNQDHPHHLGTIEVWDSEVSGHASWPGYDDVQPLAGHTTYRLRLPLVRHQSL